MWTKRSSISVLLLLVFQVCANGDALESLDLDVDSSEVSVVSQSASFFASDLYQELKVVNLVDAGNVAFSPLSLSTLLVMLYAGAAGETASEIKTALRLSGLNDSAIFGSYSNISSSLNSIESVTLRTVNAIYTDEKLLLKKSYKENLRRYFGGEAQELNFGLKQSAAETINNWVANQTEHCIKELIKPESIGDDARAVLINAIYFKGAWVHKFDAKLTEKKEFHISEKRNVLLDFMSITTHFKYAEIKRLEAEAIAIPFQGDRASLVVLLPKNTTTFADFEDRLQGFDLSKIPQDLEYSLIRLRIPKLRIESTLDFVTDGALQHLGISSVLGKNPEVRADLSNLAEPENSAKLHVSGVFQKVFVELNEVGAEAAAASASVFATKIFNPKPPQEFDANRPFVAFIFDSTTNSILFLFRKVE